MPKRKNVSRNSTTRSKIRKISSLNQESNQNLTLPQIPVEIITNIISTLTDINDLRNCMQLSKEVNSFIYRTPKIINNHRFNFNCILEPTESLNFLKNKGNHIKIMKIVIDSNSLKIMKNFFSQTPKLEEFTLVNESAVPGPPAVRRCFCCGSRQYHEMPTLEQDWKRFTTQCWTPRKGSVDLPNLKVLEIELRDLDDFIRATKKLKSLEIMTIYVTAPSDQRIMNEFIMQQHNLKELTILSLGKRGPIVFPTRNITKDVKFSLRKLKIFTNGRPIYSDMVDGFLQTQADSLEEIEFDFSLRDSNLDAIFNKFTKLTKFIQKSSNDNMLIRDPGMYWRNLVTVTHYEDMNVDGVKLNRIWGAFPNIKTLKCNCLTLSNGDFHMIRDLDVNELDISKIKNTRFLNIDNLTIGKLWELENEDTWITFVTRVQNATNLTIRGLGKIEDFPFVIKSVIIFRKLKSFKFRYNPGIKRKFVMDDNETVPTGHKFYKILVDVNQKTVKVSSYIVRRCKGILGILIRYFGDFEFFEFCFNVIAIEKLNLREHRVDIRPFYEKKKENPRNKGRSLRNLPARSYGGSRRE